MWVNTMIDFLNLAIELAILFIVISFTMNLLNIYIPYNKIERKLKGKNKVTAAATAILFAFITPFCSCSTIPLVVNMLNNKLPFGIVMIFLFASPVLDPTILTIMGTILGWKVTLLYTLATSVLSIIIGFTLEAIGFESHVKKVVVRGYQQANKNLSLKNAFYEALILVKTIFPYLIVGAAVGALINDLLPTGWMGTLFGQEQWWLVPIAAILGIPLYIRLSSMIPISQVLIIKGMALGPVMAMLISSAGASLPEIILLRSIFKKELVITFILSVITMSSISGFLFYFL